MMIKFLGRGTRSATAAQVPHHRDSGPRPRHGRNRLLCELRRKMGRWKVPQLWKSATQRADSHTCLNGPLHDPQPIHTYTQAR